MRIYLFPGHVSLRSAMGFSPQLEAILSNFDLQLEVYGWDGTLASLPAEPSIIRASSLMYCSWSELSKKCAELGHLCFYNDNVVREDGVLSNADFATKVEEFLLLHGIKPSTAHQNNGEEIDLGPFSPSMINVGGI